MEGDSLSAPFRGSARVDQQKGATIASLLGEDPLEMKRCLLIQDPHLALTSRIELIEAARDSIDVQYFIWKNDASGILVIDSLLAAADRGVQVRALVDDIEMEGLIGRITSLDEHSNIDIRIFNPFSVRHSVRLHLFRLAEFVIDGNRLNHRMHNKLLVADNQLAILGGRNIGDDYFGQSSKRHFIDTDIMLSGRIVPELSNGFEAYWNSRLARPVGQMFDLSFGNAGLSRIRERIRTRLSKRPDLTELADQSPNESLFKRFVNGPEYEWSSSIIDDPGVGRFEDAHELAEELSDIALGARKEVLVVTPYLIPTRNAMSIAKTLTEKGVKISVITNSLGSNDVVLAQAAYSGLRSEILDAGIELFEMKHKPALAKNGNADYSSLHSKFILFDDDIVFVGSQNLDPRSFYINTELGVALKSKELSDQLRAVFSELTHPDNAWRLEKTSTGILWHSSEGTLSKDPAKNSLQRFWHFLLSLIPISNQL